MADPISFDPYLGWVDITDPNNIPEDARTIGANDLLRYEQFGIDATGKINEIAETVDAFDSDVAVATSISDPESATRAALAGMVNEGVEDFQAVIDAVPAQVDAQLAIDVPPAVAAAIAADGTIVAAANTAVNTKVAALDVVVGTDSRMPQPYNSETEVDVGWSDSTDMLVFGLDVERGVTVAPIIEAINITATGDITGASVNGVELVEGVSTSGSGLLYGVVDENEMVWHPLAVDEDGRTPQFVIDDIATRMPPQTIPPATTYQPTAHPGGLVPVTVRKTVSGPDVVGFGHSMLVGAGGAGTTVLSVLASQTGLTCRNASVGGESSSAIIARQGGTPFMLLPEGGAIQASGPVVIPTFPIDGGGTSWPLLQGSGTADGKMMGTLAGVPGEIVLTRQPGAPQYVRDAGDVYTFVRTTPGSIVPVTRPMPFYYDYTALRREDIAVFWIGRNNISSYDRVFSDLKRAIQHMAPLDKRFIIISDTNGAGEYTGSATHTATVAYNKKCQDEFGRRFVDARSYIISYGLADALITPTSQDTADIAGDTIPVSLRSDGVHMNAAGYTIVGKLVAARLRELGWVI
jgi:hypothetical protein